MSLTTAEYKQLKEQLGAYHRSEAQDELLHADWVVDLLAMLGEMSLRNELLRAENEDLRRNLTSNHK